MVHVRADAAPGGADGTELHPYPSLADALRGQAMERWLLLAPGTYAGPVVLHHPTHLVGACAARVAIVGDATAPVISASATLELRGVTLRGGAGGLRVAAGATATVRGVVIASPAGYGALVEGVGATIDAEDLLVRGAAVSAEHGALSARMGATLRVNRGAVAGARAHGVRAEGTGTSVTLRDVALVDLVGTSTASGVGVVARSRATVIGERVVVDRATENCAYATGGARITLTDVVLRRPRGFTDGRQGLGLVTNGMGHIDATRALIEGCRQTAVAADGAGSDVTLHDSVVRQTAMVRGGTMGTGLGANNGGHIVADGTLVEASHDQGVIAYGSGAAVELTACEVRGTLPRGDMTQGVGVVAHTGARVTLRGVLVRGNHHVGVIAYGPEAAVDVRDVMVLETRRGLPDATGASLVAHTGGRVTGDHVALSNDIDVALQAYGRGASITLADAWMRPFSAGPRPRGLGAVAAADGVVTLTRAAMVDVDGAGLAALQAEGSPGASSLTATDVFVSAVTPRRFIGSDDPFAYALTVDRAAMALTRATVLGGEFGFVVSEGALSLTEAVVSDAERAVGVVNASPPVPLDTVTTSSRGAGVQHDVSVGSARVPPPPAPVL